MSDEENEIVNHEAIEENQSGSEGEREDVTRDSVTDSSEEDDDDENEEEIQKVREGFIVDDEDEEVESKKKRRHKKRKRERERQEEDDALDEDDLELLLENSGVKPRGQGNKLKRLKRKTSDEEESLQADASKQGEFSSRQSSAVPDIFADDDDDDDDDVDDADEELEGRFVGNDLNERGTVPRDRSNILDEFEDFIEEDELSDEDEETRKQRQLERQRMKKKGPKIDTSKLSSVDRKSLQELFEVFGDGREYEWALEAQEDEDLGAAGNEDPTSLDEVFEHSELKERMLTEEDNLIRIIDIPERYQKYRSTLAYIDLEGDELELEKQWVADVLLQERAAFKGGFLEQPFKEAVGKVVEFISKKSFEVPFIWANRRDDLLSDADGASVHKLLFEDDLWRIVKLDIEYHSLYEKRLNMENLIRELGVDDDLTMDLKSLNTMVAVQDTQDYINFTYAKEIQNLANKGKDEEQDTEGKTNSRGKKHSKYALYDRIKSNILYDGVEAYGITAKQFGENVQDQSSQGYNVTYRIHATDDSQESPDFVINKLVDDEEALFRDQKTAKDAIRRTFAEEIFHNPKIRHEVRSTFASLASISVAITEKGRNTIDNYSPYADIKYAINRFPSELVRTPDVFLRMLEAEKLGLAVITVEPRQSQEWFQSIFNCLKSDGSSEVSEQWNNEREIVLKMAFKKLCAMVALNTKEDLRRECERLIASEVRASFTSKLDQAPYKPFGYDKGTRPNVLALTFGKGDYDSAVVGVFVKDTGKVQDFFKSETNPIRDLESEEKFTGQLKEFIDKRLKIDKPDVLVISGFNANSKRLYDILKKFVEENHIMANIDELPKDTTPELIDVIWGPDETARLYQNSERAKTDSPDKPQLVRYAIGVAKYIQDPLLEYVSLGDDILSLTFHEHQKLIPIDLVKEALESAFVDLVNVTGVDINVAVRDSYVAQTLQYVAGLGPRKASGLVRNIVNNLNSTLVARSDLIEEGLTTAQVFYNCASFLYIPVDSQIDTLSESVELLDATRIHPEDYVLARKMAADAIEMDPDEFKSNGDSSVIQTLYNEDVFKVNELNLVEYGKELFKEQGVKKFSRLLTIKDELINNYEELRNYFKTLDSVGVFTMLTGETKTSFGRGSVVPITIVKVGKNYRDPSAKIRWAKGVTASMVQANIEEEHIPDNLDLFQGQVVQAVVLDVTYESFTATMSLLKDDIKRASKPRFPKEGGKWNLRAEEEDWKREREKEKAQLAKTRNIQHPLYRNFNYKQAEEFLAPQNLGDCVIRPSSKGPNYLTITWKVGNNLFQHLSVQERTRGKFKEYVVDGKTYSDLDQLIFQHIQAISRKVDEMVHHPKFRAGTMAEVTEWLESYTKANPKNSAYIFCYDHKNPGYFLLLFKVNVDTPIKTWHVRTETDGYALKNFLYTSMTKLCNGFKQVFKTYSTPSNQPAPSTGYGYNGY
ncbi:SPT6 [Candida theae]|uniref:Transcription elongation factor Spt6 n=1 Tax=Candida theae TaxID=1198502 RepID=A0AAD5BIT6_9ASCO|nr:SPT6 [Candida theae]KAI5965077.1 SPT6 [Candida theae]